MSYGRSQRDKLIPVSALSQYYYCPRRYWYYRFYDAGDRSPELVDGNVLHSGQTRQSGQYREQHYVASELGLHGTVDLIETTDEGNFVPVERKRASSGRYYWNDEVQLAGYCLLVEQATDCTTIDHGHVYLYETDERHEISITDEHRQAVIEGVKQIRSMSPDNPPELVDNPNKCRACSVRHECLPATTARLNPEAATESGWSEVTPYE